MNSSKLLDYLKMKLQLPSVNKPTKAKLRRKQSAFDKNLPNIFEARPRHITLALPDYHLGMSQTHRSGVDPERPGWAKKRDNRRLTHPRGERI